MSPPGGGRRPSRSNWPFLAIFAAAIAAGAWLLFAGPLTSSDEPESYRYVEAVVGTPARVNPLFAHLSDADRDLTALVFSGLTRLGPDGTVLPDLAETWEATNDGRTFTFHLRRGVVWHNSAPFTSDDVIFTYSLMANPSLEGDPEQAPLWRRIACSAPDDLTVVCELPDAFAPFPAYATAGILPRHLLDGIDAATLPTAPFNSKPVGTGPYKLVRLEQTGAVLEANERYHLGSPLLAGMELLFFPDSATAAAAVVRGDAKGVFLDLSATADDADAVSSTSRLRSYEANRSAYAVLYLNNSEPPLNDPVVRRAIAQALNVDAIIDSLLGGRAVRANSAIVAGTWAHNPNAAPHRRDPGRANDALTEAGWTFPDGGDIRTRGGVELRLSLMTDRDALRTLVATAIAEELADIGIAVTVAHEESTDLIRDFLIPRQYQAALIGWDPGPDPDPYPAWHSSQASDSGRNLAAYVNPKADKLLEDARRTPDLNERQRLYYAFQDIFYQDVPSIPLYHPLNTYFVSEEVKGIELGTLFSNSSRFSNVHEWYFEESPDLLKR